MKIKVVIFTLFATTLFLTGCFALQEPEAASGEAVAPTLAPAVTTEETTTSEPASEPTPLPEADSEESAPLADTETVVPEKEGQEAQPDSELSIFEIDTAQSEARFSIDEVLRGDPFTVVGVSSNLAGQVAFDINNPLATQVGDFVINARDLKTDNNFRNNAIANEILLTDEFEFITFTPKELVGLPGSAAIGETYSFQIIGDLTITDVTQEVTFDAMVTPTSETELQGLVSTTILVPDFSLTVPLSRQVTAVEDDLLLELEFVATAVANIP